MLNIYDIQIKICRYFIKYLDKIINIIKLNRFNIVKEHFIAKKCKSENSNHKINFFNFVDCC